jgi:thiol-disulfide isomerase/thioredoxin
MIPAPNSHVLQSARRLLLIVSALLLGACSQHASDPEQADALWRASGFDLADQPVALLKYRDKPLVINFWARWCPPCRDEIPDFIRTNTQFKSQGVELLGLAIEDQAPPVADFIREYKIDYPVLLTRDQGYELMVALGNQQGGLPFTVVIDRQGNIVARKVGRMSRTEMETAFAAALR